MAILGLGIDIAQIDRLEQVFARRGERFLARVFTNTERSYCDARQARFTHYAGRFAAKEAAIKALGTGGQPGVRWTDVEIQSESGAAPRLELHGATARLASRRGVANLHVAITHDGGMASAVVVAED
ncbi:MAG: holo-[acyl-carrier protein] synthase [Chlamydiales bacterium]